MNLPSMQKPQCEVKEKNMLIAILDMCKVINVGFFDDEYPYVLPLNYGYTFDDDLVFFTHHALKGYKLELIQKNPKVCVAASVFADGINNPRGSSAHDFRSIHAFGKMEKLTSGTEEYRLALRKLYECNERHHKITDSFLNTDFDKMMHLYKITCKAEDVIGKAQEGIKDICEVPLPTEPKLR